MKRMKNFIIQRFDKKKTFLLNHSLILLLEMTPIQKAQVLFGMETPISQVSIWFSKQVVPFDWEQVVNQAH